jgi:hypothetical protein
MSGSCLRLAVAVVLIGACGPKGKSATPEPGADGGTRAASEGESSIVYRPAKLTAAVTLELTSTGGGAYLQANATLRTDLEIAPQGADLLVRWDVAAVDGLQIEGTLPPSQVDLSAYLAEHGRGVWVVDAFGRENAKATDAHPDNAARRQLVAGETRRLGDARAQGKSATPDPAPTLLDRIPPMLALPPLPMPPLVPGATDERTTTTEVELPQFDVVLPIETTRRVTLVVIDTSGTMRLAELQITEDRYGGLELEEGDIELEEKSEGTLLFDLDRGVPFRFEQTTTTSFTAGDRGGDTTRIVRTEFEPRG